MTYHDFTSVCKFLNPSDKSRNWNSFYLPIANSLSIQADSRRGGGGGGGITPEYPMHPTV